MVNRPICSLPNSLSDFDNSAIDEILTRHGVRPTAVRVLIYRQMATHSNTFSLTDLETELDTVDKSTLFRTLTLFSAHQLLHETEDGSGMKKYCLCRNDHFCTPEEMHVHFYCEKCQQTYCLDNVLIPHVNLPSGFQAREIEYLVKGRCANCSK